eukprot:gnl/Dysnectes_brevis/1919_a2204_1831.p1 GENE.gnl/Dysnectes_brevis/1919_a2204_1831~~gnl/Dysnectes_brevis/1919_a2204_1831.p1  ORF type:complete len:325 (-),score=91.77 gnl/Dysnectes_brevis/1919_a2204_1831:26-1000(-)
MTDQSFETQVHHITVNRTVNDDLDTAEQEQSLCSTIPPQFRGKFVLPGDILGDDLASTAKGKGVISGFRREEVDPLKDTDMGEELHQIVSDHADGALVNKLLASQAGLLKKQDHVVSVHPIREPYAPAKTHIVIGRVSRLSPGRWWVDLNTTRVGVLSINSVNLPGHLRRRSSVDEQNMRNYFVEGDLLCAEIQKTGMEHKKGKISTKDQAVTLFTRSMLQGKLEHGFLMEVPPILLQASRRHMFHIASCDTSVIIGRNGYVWLSPPRPLEGDASSVEDRTPREVSLELRQGMVLAAETIRHLVSVNMQVTEQNINKLLEATDE